MKKFTRIHLFSLIILRMLCGFAFAEPLTFDPDNPPAQFTPPTEVYNEYTGSNSWRLGPKTVMVFRVYPSDRDPWTNYKSDAALLNELHSASANFYRASYHQTWFGPKRKNGMDIPMLVVTPPMQLPGTYAQYRDNFALLQSHSRAAAEALGPEWRDGGIYHHIHYDRHVAMSNANMVGSAGRAYVGGKFSWTGGSLSGGVAVHELGHNWGVVHANSWYAPSGVDPEVHPRSPLRQNGEYQDGWCIMGGGNTTLMFNPLFRYILRFVTRERGEVQDVTASGRYRIYNYLHEDRLQLESRVRVLNIPITNYARWDNVFLGFGHRSGVDGGWGRTDYNRNAVTVHSALSSGSNRIDTTPNSRPGSEDRNDSSIKIGRTYSEGPNENGAQMYGGFHVTPVLRGSSEVNGQTHEWIEVMIHYGDDVVGNQPPVASFSDTVFTGAEPGVPFAITVDASDPENDELAFDWDFGDDSYNIVNGATQTKTWAEPGIYLVEVTVSDMKGGLTEASVWVKVGEQEPIPPVTPESVLSGLSFRYYEGSFNAMPDFVNLMPVAEGTVSSLTLAPRQRNDDFGFVFEGLLEVPATDIYTFHLKANDGAILRIADQLVVDNDGTKSQAIERSGNLELAAGLHPFQITFFHRSGSETLELRWNTLNQSPALIGSSVLKREDPATRPAPEMVLLTPSEGEQFLVGSDVLLEAAVTPAAGDAVERVQFFADNALVGTVFTGPYSFLWENVSVGNREIQVVVWTESGGRFLADPVSIEVTSPPPTRSIGINFGADDADRQVFFNERAGAVYAEPNWNNIGGNMGENLDLVDNRGFASPATLLFASGPNFGGTFSTLGDTSNGAARLMRGGVTLRGDTDWNEYAHPTAVVSHVPYNQYDVYVYFDYPRDRVEDTRVSRFVLTPEGEPSWPARYGQNADNRDDDTGDFPTYQSWNGFRESVATDRHAPLEERLGNYVVFRGVTRAGFSVESTYHADGTEIRRFINAVQIVESVVEGPGLRLVRPAQGWRTREGDTAVPYLVALNAAPDGPVTVSLQGDDQVTVSPGTLTFDAANWDLPQTAFFQAVDDDVQEGPHSGILLHTLNGSGHYAEIEPVSLSIAIEDNDLPMIALYANGTPREEGEEPGYFQVFRKDMDNLDRAVSVDFVMSGDAQPGVDYHLSGPGLTFSNATGEGMVLLPAGQKLVTITLTPVDNSLKDGNRSAVMTLEENPGSYRLEDPFSAALTVMDNDEITHFAQRFSWGYKVSSFNLHNSTLTFTPDGSQNFYAPALRSASAYPTDFSTHTNLVNVPLAGSNHTLRNGFWELDDFPVSFFGQSYDRIFVSTNGGVTFGSGDLNSTLSSNDAFYQKVRAALYWRDLDVSQGGAIYFGRVDTPGEERIVITYDQVLRAVSSSSSHRLNAQMELWDNGRITFTWLDVGSGTLTNPWVGLSDRASGLPVDWEEFNFSALPDSDTEETNRPPFFLSTGGYESRAGEELSFTVLAGDPDGDALTLTASDLPAWLSFTDQGDGVGLLSGTPPTPGTFSFSLSASDGEDTTTVTRTLNVLRADGTFGVPNITSTPDSLLGIAGETWTYLFTATDPDNLALRMDALSLPSWLTLTDYGDGTALISGTVPPVTLPSEPVDLVADNGFGTSIQSFVLNYQRPPQIAFLRPARDLLRIATPEHRLHLEAEVTSYGGPAGLLWEQTAGPAPAVFSHPTSEETEVDFPVDGLYILRLTADDGEAVSSRSLRILVGETMADLIGSGLLGYWDMNETEGEVLHDQSGQENHAQINNNGGVNLLLDGPEGTALGLTGSLNYAEVAGLGQPEAFTFSGWVLSEASPATGTRVLFTFLSGTTNRTRVETEADSSKLRFISNHSTAGIWEIDYRVPALEWFHLVVQYDRSSTANDPVAYINGQPVNVDRVRTPSGANNNSNTFWMGSLNRTVRSWRGGMDDVRLHDRLLDPADIPLLMHPGPVNSAPAIALEDVRTAPSQTVSLGAEVTDDGRPDEPGVVDTLWIQESGLGDGVIAAPNLPDSEFTTGPFSGLYELRLFADDGEALVSRGLTVFSEGGDPLAPEITEQPQSLTVTELEEATFSVGVNANPAPEFQWRKDGADIPGATQATYTIAETSLGDAGDYTVYIWNEEGNVTSEVATLTVNPIPPEAPAITRQPESQSAVITQSVTFSVEATGHPAPEFQWRKDGVDLPGETGATLTLTDLTLADSGDYDVVVSNSVDTVFSEVATLTVAEGPSAPTILTHPQGQTVNEGDPVLLTVEATGNPSPTYQWRFNGNPISGAEQDTFEIASAGPANSGSYDVVVSNSEGTLVSDSAGIEVPYAPVITSQPQALTVTVGEPASFAVSATGNPAPAYQWYFDGTPLAGETGAVLSLSQTAFSDAGSYHLELSNSLGTVSSDVVTLTVNPGPVTIALQRPTVQDVRIPEGVGLVLETEVTETGGESGQVTRLWERVSGDGTVTWDNTDQEHTAAWFSAQGNYTLRLTADNGANSDVLEIAVEVVDPALIDTEAPLAGSMQSVPTDNLAVHLRLDESSGTEAADDSGNNRDGAITGSPEWRPGDGVVGGALRFTGDNQYATLDNSDNLDGTQQMTWVWWMRPSSSNSNVRGVLSKRTDQNRDRSWSFFLHHNNQLNVDMPSSGNRLSVGTIPANEWTHVAVVFDGSLEESARVRVFFNGEISGTHSASISSIPNESSSVTLGTLDSGDSRSFRGDLDEVLIYHGRALTAEEIAGIHAGESGANIGPLVEAGSDQTVPVNTEVTLAGTVADDGLPEVPGTVTTEWLQLGGPAVLLSDAASLNPTFTPTESGTYLFRLTAFDGEIATAADVTVTVEADASDPYQDWLAANDLEAEDEVSVDGQTFTPLQLYIMNAEKDEQGAWQGVLLAQAILPDGNGGMALAFNARAGRRYILERTEDLTQPVWEPLGSPLESTGESERSFPVSLPQNGRAFYRIRVERME